MAFGVAAFLVLWAQWPPIDLESVVMSVADTFFVSDNPDFNKGDVVVLNPNWYQGGMDPFGAFMEPDKPYNSKTKEPLTFNKSRAKWNFDKAIATWIENSEYRIKHEREKSKEFVKWEHEEEGRLATLKRVQKSQRTSKSAEKTTTLGLKNLYLGERVVVGTRDDFLDKKKRYGWFSGENEIKRLNGSVAKVRTIGTMTEPLFSSDRKFAFSSISIPWSIHSASFVFLLEKGEHGTWKVIAKLENYFL